MGCEIFEPVFGRFRSRGSEPGMEMLLFTTPARRVPDCFPVIYCMAENVFGWRKVI